MPRIGRVGLHRSRRPSARKRRTNCPAYRHGPPRCWGGLQKLPGTLGRQLTTKTQRHEGHQQFPSCLCGFVVRNAFSSPPIPLPGPACRLSTRTKTIFWGGASVGVRVWAAATTPIGGRRASGWPQYSSRFVAKSIIRDQQNDTGQDQRDAGGDRFHAGGLRRHNLFILINPPRISSKKSLHFRLSAARRAASSPRLDKPAGCRRMAGDESFGGRQTAGNDSRRRRVAVRRAPPKAFSCRFRLIEGVGESGGLARRSFLRGRLPR